MEHFNGNPDREQSFGLVPTSARAVVVQSQRPEVAGPYDVYDREGGSDSGSAIGYARILLRHKGKLCLFALGGILLGIAVGIPFTPVYRVRTSLEVLSMNKDFMNTNQTSPVATNDDSYETSEEETQVQLLQSDALIDRVFNKFDPGLVYIRHNPRIADSGWRKLLNMPPHIYYTERQKLLKGLADSLKVKADPRTRVIEMTASSTDPKLTADFVNSLANEFIGQAIEARLRTTEKIGDWLGHELDSTRAKLERSEAALQTYAGKSGLIFTTTTTADDTNIETEKLQQIQGALTTQIADRVAKEARNELALHAPPDSLADVLSDDNLRTAQAAAVDAARQVADLSTVFTPDFSKVKRMTAQQATLQTAYEEQRANVIARVKNDYAEALHKEKLLEAAYDTQAREVIGQDEKAIQYNILKRDVDGNRQLYDTMMQQLEQSSIASALHASNARVFDPATLPQKPIWPNYMILAPLGLLFGILAGLWAIFVIERMDRSLRQPGEIQAWTNLPELGTIPSASLDPGKKVRIKVLTGASDPARRDLLTTEKKVDRSVELITWLRKPSMLAEAFRATLTSILFVGENGSRPRVVALTSANAADGKTTVTTNLAIAMAEVRGNVLVIDADMRRPRLHTLFEVANERGLSELLKEPTLSAEVISKSIQQTRVPGLAVLTAGATTHSAANLLHSANLGELLDKLKEQYDMVLIDTPPMLQIADARLIGRHADAVVLVARAEKTTRDAIIAAYQRLAEDRIRVLGTVLNDWNPKRSPAGYYGYYRAYGYGSYKSHYGESASS
jgi:succinoglycan biosynthesis transport protein ExoP